MRPGRWLGVGGGDGLDVCFILFGTGTEVYKRYGGPKEERAGDEC